MNDQLWIWQHSDWPNFFWQDERVQPRLRQVRYQQGILAGKTGNLSESGNLENVLDTLLQNIIASSAIEGEQLNVQSVRSSLAKRIGLSLKQAWPTSERSEGLAQLMIDAIGNLNTPLSTERLMQWHHYLFPDVETSLYPIDVGQLRGDEPMQVVSGRTDKPTVHFEAPPRVILEQELTRFIEWFNESRENAVLDPLIRAAISHFWFVTVHPFDDGNGRITRALTDLALAQDDQQSIRLYAMSVSILAKRKEYYQILESSQRNSLDITSWLSWFLDTLADSVHTAILKIDRTLDKTRLWHRFQAAGLNTEQIRVLNRLLDEGEAGFAHGISAAQYQKLAKVSKATATRHLTDLLAKGCLVKLPGGGRNTRYKVNPNP